MRYLAIYCLVLVFGQVLLLDVVQNKTGAEQVKDALSKAEKESNLAAKTQEKVETSVPSTATSKEKTTITAAQDSKTFLDTKKNKDTKDDKLDSIIATKVAQLEELHKKHKELAKENESKFKENSKLISVGDNNVDNLSESIKKAEEKAKENSELEEASDKKMLEMAKKLNTLVLKFQKKMGHLTHDAKVIEDSTMSSSEDDSSTKKIARGKPATADVGASTVPGGIDLAALRRALGLFKSKGLKMKSAEDTNIKASYKEDVKLEDRLALEAEEEKKVTNGDTYDEDGAAEAAAGVDKSSVASAVTSETSSLSPRETASQEMQSYTALISSESNRELTQIQDEINKATQSSMGKVSVVGQRENVQTEAPSLPSLPGLGGFGGAGGGGFEQMLGGEGAPGGPNDPLAAALAANGGGDGDLSAVTGGSDINAQQTTSINDLTGGNPMDGQSQQQPGGNAAASLNLGGETPIEVGSNTPVDMGMFGGASNQQAQTGAESAPRSMEMQSNIVESRQNDQLVGEQGMNPSLAFKKSKITEKQKKTKINRFNKQKNYKRTIWKKGSTSKRGNKLPQEKWD